jgi:hypothetical protein
MTIALMILIGGVLSFLSILVPIIVDIWRWGTQKGIHRMLISVCISLVALSVFVTGIIGSHGHWNMRAVLLCFLASIILISVVPVVLGGVVTWFQVAPFVLNLLLVAILLAINYTDWRIDTLKKELAQQAGPTPSPKSTPAASK